MDGQLPFRHKLNNKPYTSQDFINTQSLLWVKNPHRDQNTFHQHQHSTSITTHQKDHTTFHLSVSTIYPLTATWWIQDVPAVEDFLSGKKPRGIQRQVYTTTCNSPSQHSSLGWHSVLEVYIHNGLSSTHIGSAGVDTATSNFAVFGKRIDKFRIVEIPVHDFIIFKHLQARVYSCKQLAVSYPIKIKWK